jgi:hypothetical protein
VLIGVVVLGTFLLLKSSPRILADKISGVTIGENLPDFVDYIRIPGTDLSCLPDNGKQWVCETVLEGKRLELTANYSNGTNFMLTGCTATYDGKPARCNNTFGHGYSAQLLIYDNLGISPARMAEIRAGNPFLYANEGTWMMFTTIVSAIISFQILLVLLTIFNKNQQITLPRFTIKFPIWAVCIVTILLALAIHSLTFSTYVMLFGVVGALLLAILIVYLNRLDILHGNAPARLLKWAAASIAIFWLLNMTSLIVLLFSGVVD